MKKRGFGEGYWNGVGGKVEGKETVEETAIREAKEEIIVHLKVFEKVAELNFDHKENPTKNQKVHVFLCEKWKGNPKETDEMKPLWFSQEHIPYNAMWSDDKIWLPKIIAGEKLTGTFYFDEKYNIFSYDLDTVDFFVN